MSSDIQSRDFRLGDILVPTERFQRSVEENYGKKTFIEIEFKYYKNDNIMVGVITRTNCWGCEKTGEYSFTPHFWTKKEKEVLNKEDFL